MNWMDFHLYQFNIGEVYASDSIVQMTKVERLEEELFGRHFE